MTRPYPGMVPGETQAMLAGNPFGNRDLPAHLLADLRPRTDARRRLLLMVRLHINNLPDTMVDSLNKTLDDHFDIRPIKTRHLPYVGD